MSNHVQTNHVQSNPGDLQSQLYAREKWVEACQFHDLTDQEVLEKVVQQASVGQNPTVLLDLDSTLYEVGHRTYQIMMEWALSKDSQGFPEVQAAILQMLSHQTQYSVQETLVALNCCSNSNQLSEATQSAMSFWMDRFFTDAYLSYDRPYAGAAEFVHRLHTAGVEIVYLTGRDSPNMGKGTVANLIRDAFPWGASKIHLLMKPTFHQPDLDFKKSAALSVRQLGTLIASFENEPPNIIALAELFPEAMHVFVDTVCANHGAISRQGLYKIRRYLSQ
jgi:hypothetical protein